MSSRMNKLKAIINHSITPDLSFERFEKMIGVEVVNFNSVVVKTIFFRRTQDAALFIDGFNLHSDLFNDKFEVEVV